MDLSKFDTSKTADDGVKMQLRDPKDESVVIEGMSITVAGLDSARYREAERKQTDFRLEQSRVAGRPGKMTTAGIEADRINLLVACTIAWEGFDLDGKPLECTPENARKVYSNPGLRWIREQVDRFVGDRANFLKA